IAFCRRSRLAIASGNGVNLGTLDLVLRNVGVRVMGIALVVDIPHMHANDRATDPSGLGTPTHAIADLEGFGHDGSVQCLARGIAAAFRILGATMGRKRALSSIR